MLMSRRGSGRASSASTAGYLIGALIAASIGLSSAHAATFGHSRIISALGRPLHLEIPVTGLTQAEIESLRAVPAPAPAWPEAGMTPPVALDSMRLVLLDGYRPDVKVIQLRSDQVFDQPVVDVLLDIRSASGQQRYQVSLLAHADRSAIQRAGGEGARHPRVIDGRPAAPVGSHPAEGRQIAVRRGDTMFAVAERHAVSGVTVYQMMIALQQANRDAFIEDNVNLLKAGSTLVMPGMDALTALSDREARRIFQQHAQAFARYRQRGAGASVAALPASAAVAQGDITAGDTPSGDTAAVPPAAGDRLRLSGGGDASSASASAASKTGDEARSAEGRGGAAMGAGASAGAGAKATGDGGHGKAGAPLNMLAASGAIASDATSGSADGSGAGRAAAGGSAAADDDAAVRKGMNESQTRILELEDNVRHLNEALQKQGQVAAEAAMEGARSVSEAIKDAIGLKEPGQGGAQQAPGTSSAQEGGAPGVGDALGPGASASKDITRPGSTPAASGGDIPGSAASSEKAETNVSWLYENLIAILAGGLALIVLIVVWVLRRMGAPRRDVFESDSPITDSMVREKLREIDLDLETTSPDTAGRRGA